uniref:Uncharacterized protein n=1 Tax=Marseillevirus LCMAC102 TaxID=2506603 RepID=A0A481YTY7_9VIRU|nr:MAG: hypothetical protein LCMAC102_02020 [Marseillevirus LCMAC102]
MSSTSSCSFEEDKLRYVKTFMIGTPPNIRRCRSCEDLSKLDDDNADSEIILTTKGVIIRHKKDYKRHRRDSIKRVNSLEKTLKQEKLYLDTLNTDNPPTQSKFILPSFNIFRRKKKNPVFSAIMHAEEDIILL